MNLLDKEILLVDKPAGMSSFGVVARIRRILTEQKGSRGKVGHAGTLDPFATGLLICLLGKGTKKAGEYLKKDKRYTATICLGKVSTTGDIEGEISEYEFSGHRAAIPPSRVSALSFSPVAKKIPENYIPDISQVESLEEHIPTISDINTVIKSFQGEIVQKVPAYSAVKIDGRRAYDLARKGVEVEMPERKVTIYNISVLKYEWPELVIDCKVSSGTYIRALGEDIGKALGVGGYLTALRRTEIGDMKVSDAVTLEEIGVKD